MDIDQPVAAAAAPQPPPPPVLGGSSVKDMRRRHATKQKRVSNHADTVLAEVATRGVYESTPARANSEMARVRRELVAARDQLTAMANKRRANDPDYERAVTVLTSVVRMCNELMDAQRTLQCAWMAFVQDRAAQDLAALLGSPDEQQPPQQ